MKKAPGENSRRLVWHAFRLRPRVTAAHRACRGGSLHCEAVSAALTASVLRNPHTQCVELDEAAGIGLVVRAAVVVERGDGLVEQGFLRIPRDHRDAALVQLHTHPAVDLLLRVVDQYLDRTTLRAPPVAVVN